MVATETQLNTSRGWLTVLFGAQPAAPVQHRSQVRDYAASPQMVAMLVAAELTEERARAATSGFEMGEYEPLARRN
ncbi:MAG: hypothetical protein KF849_08115 [Rhizobiaceae bacterium]|nr:hypothetical protein [Rhizobiaceae bacterium]